MENDTRLFPIQASKPYRDATGKMIYTKSSKIPWWLAEEAYRYYVKCFGNSQSLKRLAERGGFGREELLSFLRCEIVQGSPVKLEQSKNKTRKG